MEKVMMIGKYQQKWTVNKEECQVLALLYQLLVRLLLELELHMPFISEIPLTAAHPRQQLQILAKNLGGKKY